MPASGGSALGNHSIGAGAVGGMLTGVMLGVFVIPVLYVIFQHIQERVSRKKEENKTVYLFVLMASILLTSGECLEYFDGESTARNFHYRKIEQL